MGASLGGDDRDQACYPWRTFLAITLGALVIVGVAAGRAWVW